MKTKYFSFEEFASIEDKNKKLNQLLDDQNRIKNSCLLCKEHEVTIGRLQQTLTKLNEQYDTIKSQYQRLLSTQYTPAVSRKPDEYNYISKHQYSLSTRLNNDHEGLFLLVNLDLEINCCSYSI
jgi:hypothetical protein